jgi:hypothetical protein
MESVKEVLVNVGTKPRQDAASKNNLVFHSKGCAS